MSDWNAFDYSQRSKHNVRMDLPEITAGQIERIDDLKPQQQPVFKVTFKGGPAAPSPLVVKLETGGSAPAMLMQRYVIAADLMNFVSSTARAALLTSAEIAALKFYATPYMNVCSAQANSFWVKMKFKSGLGDLQQIELGAPTFTTAQIAEMTKIAPLLARHDRFWSSLGEILVIDLFIGNNDRISWNQKKSKAYLQNPGNVFVKFDGAGQVKKAIGMDFFVGTNPEANIENPDSAKWKTNYAPVLQSQELQLMFLSDVVAEINRHFKKAGIITAFDKSELVSLRMGFNSAIVRLKSTLLFRSKNNKGFKGSVWERAAALGWL